MSLSKGEIVVRVVDLHLLKEDWYWKPVSLSKKESGVNVGHDDRTTIKLHLHFLHDFYLYYKLISLLITFTTLMNILSSQAHFRYELLSNDIFELT